MPVYLFLAEIDRNFHQYGVYRILKVFECSMGDIERIWKSREVVEIQAEVAARGSYIQSYIFYREPQNPLHEISTR